MGVVNDGDAQWIIRDLRNPALERTTGHVLPKKAQVGSIQTFVRITGSLSERYEYLFEIYKRWEPVYDESAQGTAIAAPEVRDKLAAMQLIPAEHLPWYRVTGLTEGSDKADVLVREVSPDSGRFLLYSKGRRPLGPTEGSTTVGPRSPTGPIPADVWFAIAKWAKEKQLLQGKQRGIAYSLGELTRDRKSPSDKQAAAGKKLLLEAINLGFSHSALTEEVLKRMRSQP